MKCGEELAYVALVVDDVEAAAAVWQKDFDLQRSDVAVLNDSNRVPLLHVGNSALALFAVGDAYLGKVSPTGVHHMALAVDDLDKAIVLFKEKAVDLETGEIEPSLGGGRRVLLSLQATNGLRTYVTEPFKRDKSKAGFIERLDHLGVLGTNNEKALDIYGKRLGCAFNGEQTDTEVQIAAEHFVYSHNGVVRTVVHNRPAEFVAAVHDVFIGVGDTDLEILQVLDQGLQKGSTVDRPGNTKRDHGALARFLESRGPGLHHIALKVANIDQALDRLHRANHRLIDRHARPGARCSRIGFINPKSMNGVLVHLVERET
jgi:methylmalonyl-CoA epimerase